MAWSFAQRVVVGAMASASAAAAAPPPGRVVRIERARANGSVAPILCAELRANGGICIGARPQAGDTIVVVDDTHAIAEFRVTGASSYMPTCDMFWTITGELIRGDLSAANRSQALGLIDPLIDRRTSRRIADAKIPPPEPGAKVGFGVDRDGDGTADVVATSSACGAQTGPEECIDVWVRVGGRFSKAWSTNLRNCIK